MVNFQKRKLALCVAMIGACGHSQVALSQNEVIQQEEVLVTGFRASLVKAQELKRNAVGARESIIAEDMGKMPDLNLAESLQRIPGAAVVRQGGEGRQISLRGLGPGFTHVTLNGMEVPSSTGGLDSSGGVNRGRAFDYNVFSSELFSRIDVNKTPTSNLEEGGIAGSVDLYTLRPLDNPGRKISLAGQLGYNDISEEVDPRLSATYSDSNEDATIGWMLSATRTERKVNQDGFGTVRWSSPSVDGCTDPAAGLPADRCFAGNNTDFTDAEVNNAWYPRIPRQDSFHHEQDRTGFSGALQFRPADDLEFGLNHVRSTFEGTVDSYNSFAQFRRNGQWGWFRNTVESLTIEDQAGTPVAVAGQFSGVGLRTESRRQQDKTEFAQTTVDLKWNISESLVLTGMLGQATSDYLGNVFRANIETLNDNPDTAAVDDGGVIFTYDFTGDANIPAITYSGIDVTDEDEYYLMSDAQLREYSVDRTNNTQRLDLGWSINDENSVKVGLMLNDREIDSTQANRPNEAGPFPGDGTALDGLTDIYRYDDIGGYGSATQLDFRVLNFDRAIAAHGTADYVTQYGGGINTWTVTEETTAAYVDYTMQTELGDHPFTANAGVRFVKTDVTAGGYAGNAASFFFEETNSYNNSLPSLNLTYGINEDMQLRLGLAKTLTRPAPGSLAPSQDFTNTNQTVSEGNPQLDPMTSQDLNLAWEWYFSDEGYVAFAYFSKDIDSFITSFSGAEEPLRPGDEATVARLYPDQPELLNDSWEYSAPINGDGTEVTGYELAYQQPFTGAPSFLSNMGVIFNYSYVDATTIVEYSDGPQRMPLEGLSENAYNFTIYYEVDAFAVRLATNSRDDYSSDNTGSNGNRTHGTTGPTQVDLSAVYNFTDNLTLTFEAINLNDESERLFTTGPEGNNNLVREFNKTGRQFFLGLRATF